MNRFGKREIRNAKLKNCRIYRKQPEERRDKQEWTGCIRALPVVKRGRPKRAKLFCLVKEELILCCRAKRRKIYRNPQVKNRFWLCKMPILRRTQPPRSGTILCSQSRSRNKPHTKL